MWLFDEAHEFKANIIISVEDVKEIERERGRNERERKTRIPSSDTCLRFHGAALNRLEVTPRLIYRQADKSPTTSEEVAFIALAVALS